jgi:superfamily II DNA/RNA helicase
MVADSSPSDTWESVSPWLHARLTSAPLNFRGMLPVQKKVVPFLSRAIASGIAMDACISAPTGSGKTLCYLLPMLSMIAERKAVVNVTELQAIILVPTKALASQVHHVLKCLTSAAKGQKQLKKKTDEPGDSDEDNNVEKEEHADASGDTRPLIRSVVVCGGMTPREESANLVRRVKAPRVSCTFTDGFQAAVDDKTTDGVIDDSQDEEFFYSQADVLIATPQRVLKHLGSTKGFSLRHLRMLIVDEADEILSGTFSNFAGTIVHYFEEEQERRRQAQQQAGGAGVYLPPQVLHKVLCSATMTTHLARVSEIRLRNCKVFSLDTMGGSIRDDTGLEQAEGAIKARVSTQFHLPPNLKEHMLIVRDDQRHVVLLRLVRELLGISSAVSQTKEAAPDVATSAALLVPKSSNGVLIFCATADTARVVGRFLTLGGVPALEFTSLATEVDRRRALISGIAGTRREVIVTTDALMRGVDMPGVRHVVMYDPPRSLQQYVHRAGRTARALLEGNAYVLLSKFGPSGTLVDGEVAQFKALDSLLKRTTPLVYAKGLQTITPECVEEANTLLARTQKALNSSFRSRPAISKSSGKSAEGAADTPAAAQRKRARND